jgi:hypothetical protein
LTRNSTPGVTPTSTWCTMSDSCPRCSESGTLTLTSTKTKVPSNTSSSKKMRTAVSYSQTNKSCRRTNALTISLTFWTKSGVQRSAS